MEQVTYIQFLKRICKDFNLELETEYVLPLPATKKQIKQFTTSRAKDVRIFDGKCEHPYMISENQRNSKTLTNGVQLRYKGYKPLGLLTTEANIQLNTKSCKICEGGGWYSNGTQYSYEDIYIEL